MALTHFLERFKALHEKAKKGKLEPSERTDYERDCNELATALLAATKETLKPGESARSVVKAAKAMQVEIQLPADKVKTMTVEVWGNGFSALMAEGPKAGTEVRVWLRVSGNDSITASATVLESKRQPHNTRVSFLLVDAEEKDRAKLEWAVFDEVLAKLSAHKR